MMRYLLYCRKVVCNYKFIHFRYLFQNDRITEIIRVKDLPEQLSSCLRCVFSVDSKNLFVVNPDRNVIMFEVNISDSVIIDYRETIDTNKFIKNQITQILVSHCGTYLVCAGLCCNIAVWKRNARQRKLQQQWEHHINLPKYILTPTAMAIHSNSPKLVVVFADSKLFEYHLEELKFVYSTAQKFFDNQEFHVIKNIVLNPENEDVYIFQNDECIFAVKKVLVSKFNIISFIAIFFIFFFFFQLLCLAKCVIRFRI